MRGRVNLTFKKKEKRRNEERPTDLAVIYCVHRRKKQQLGCFDSRVDIKELYDSDPCSDFILITNDEITLISGLSPGNDNVGTKG